MRVRTRVAVSVLVCQIGSSARSTSAVSIAMTGSLPSRGKA